MYYFSYFDPLYRIINKIIIKNWKYEMIVIRSFESYFFFLFLYRSKHFTRINNNNIGKISSLKHAQIRITCDLDLPKKEETKKKNR